MAGPSSQLADPFSSSSHLAGPPFDLLGLPLLHLLSLHPLASVHGSILPLLSDVLHNYLSLICRITGQSARHAGRTSINPWDVVTCLDQVGPIEDLQDMKRWMSSEERKEWGERMEAGFGTGSSGAKAREDWETRKMALRLAVKRRSISEVAKGKMRWMTLREDELALYQELQTVEEDRLKIASRSRRRRRNGSPSGGAKRSRTSGSTSQGFERAYEDAGNSDGEKSGSDTMEGSEDENDDNDDGLSIATGRTSVSPAPDLLPSDEELYKGRSLQNGHSPSRTRIWYVPSFLPPFPGQEDGQPRAHEQPIATEASISGTTEGRTANGSLAPVDVDDGDVVHPASGPEASPIPDASSASYFAGPTPFAASSLFKAEEDGTQLPPLDTFPFLPDNGGSARTPSSSHSAFVDAYTSLSSSGETPTLLPQTVHRRQIALQLSQPSNYAPMDTLYGGISARPSAMPFTPNASHLITLPANGGAPRFTPTRPKGRPLELASSSGVSHPIFGYRKPAHSLGRLARNLLAGAPVVSVPRPETGSSTNANDLAATITSLNPEGLYTPPLSILHRSLHIMDPPPLRDEGYVERVFRGAALSGEEGTLTRGENWLKAGVDAVEVASGEKVKSGTLVYTWDWVGRECTKEGAD
ncbi:hypothetical protein BCV69DRAFT_282998 [Microstroma glucosiphilum]|uniref:Bromodomain associated domain-containing protein n=1 Tax=Pseudomicrostroma glucosiphilum TaxID=1684307 RepID=A0A316U6E4_9BASI|nr:hypothetical protein BCV69DRAFT_282998 [Pseudomicrostroma glucosiphilum]PWN20780.1 hypothetical protein BCV69DRAFT_282998 [Pseudomicrostroma glucosiphilum]